MAASKKTKEVRQKESPAGKHIVQNEDPKQIYTMNPAWHFSSCDTQMWAFDEENAGRFFWNEILPRLRDWETQTWSEILLTAKKQNHFIQVEALNPAAQKRLAEKYIESDSIVSLRLNGTHRIYGYFDKEVFQILWFDPEHGDNNTCVCRSYLKHT